jgi:hypothetical protein
MIGLTGLFDTARDYILQFTITRPQAHTSVHSHVFTTFCWVAASNEDVPLPPGSRTVPGLSCQLLQLSLSTHNSVILSSCYRGNALLCETVT